MRLSRAIAITALSLVLLTLASACGGIDSVRDRLSGSLEDSSSEQFTDRAEETVASLGGTDRADLEVLTSETVTLQQLQDAGIPVGSYQIDCDQPLHIVIVEGMLDRESLFETGATLAGGHAEGMAMKLVARIYDPETDNPLGMIGDPDGGRLNNISEGGSMPSGGSNGVLMFESEGGEQAGALVPEAVCQ